MIGIEAMSWLVMSEQTVFSEQAVSGAFEEHARGLVGENRMARRKKADEPAGGKQKQAARSAGKATARSRRRTKKQEAAQMIAASDSLAFISKEDMRRHINQSLKPLQRIADQAGLHFLAYILGMAVEESSSERDRQGGMDTKE